MREVVIQAWCDVCIEQGRNTVAEPVDLTWNNRDVSLDLCEEHVVPFRELDRLVAAYGHTRKLKQVKSKKPAAPPSPQVVQHAPTGSPSSTAEDSTTFLQGDGFYHCPDCARSFGRSQSLGAHRYRHHGYRRDR